MTTFFKFLGFKLSGILLVLLVLASITATAQENMTQGVETEVPQSVEAPVFAFYRALNTGDLSLLEQALAPDWTETPTFPEQQPGRNGFGPVVQGFRQTFSGLHFEIDDRIIAGDASDAKVTVRSTATGKHAGELFGVAPTGNDVVFTTIDVHRVRDGYIVETWHVEDFLSVLGQIAPERLGATESEGGTP